MIHLLVLIKIKSLDYEKVSRVDGKHAKNAKQKSNKHLDLDVKRDLKRLD